jgi:phosphomannomutase/phosphoglucomutase
MITGSHNPSEYNGFKVVSGASTIHGDQIQEVRELIENPRSSLQKLHFVRTSG